MAIMKRMPIMKTKPMIASLPPELIEEPIAPSPTMNNPKETIKKLKAPIIPIPANGQRRMFSTEGLRI